MLSGETAAGRYPVEGFILLAEILHIQIDVGQVNSLMVADFPAVYNNSLYIGICNFSYFNYNFSIINEYQISTRQFFGEICVQSGVCWTKMEAKKLS